MVVARRGHEDIGLVDRLFHCDDLVAFHRGLQGTNRIDFRHPDLGAQRGECLRRTLADIPVAGDNRDLAGDHDVSRALDAVDERLTAAIQVVELGLGDRIVDVDGGKGEFALFGHLVEAMHAGRRLFGHALDLRQARGIPARIALELFADRGEQYRFFFGAGIVQHGKVGFSLGAQVQQQRGIAAVVKDHVGLLVARPLENTVGVVPVFGQVFALHGKDWRTGRCDRGGSVVLRREDVARRPANLRAQGLQRFNQHSRLDRHVQAAGDPRALQGLGRRELFTRGHQARHFGFGNGDLATAPAGEADVGDNVVSKFFGHSIHLSRLH